MAQLFLDVLGKHGMLAIWSLIIVVQVRDRPLPLRKPIYFIPSSMSPALHKESMLHVLYLLSHETTHCQALDCGKR